MEFRTGVPVTKQGPGINYDSRIFLTGSCFVENIGKKLEYYQFQQLLNPLGILFHPFAIENLFQRLDSNFRYLEEDIFFHNERWHSFEAHSALSASRKEDLLDNLHNALEGSRRFLKNVTHIVITPGTARYYHHLQDDKNVANCHKIPQKYFEKLLASPEEIKKSFSKTLSHIRNLATEARVIFTISPVRHLKDGVVENQWSKANLINAVQEVVSENEAAYYFPSYEIMMDEFRDYRFYAEDMIHPSSTAVDYIWKRFSEAWIAAEATSTMQQVEKIRRGLSHRPFNENSEAHQKFLNNLEEEIKMLQEDFPHMSF